MFNFWKNLFRLWSAYFHVNEVSAAAIIIIIICERLVSARERLLSRVRRRCHHHDGRDRWSELEFLEVHLRDCLLLQIVPDALFRYPPHIYSLDNAFHNLILEINHYYYCRYYLNLFLLIIIIAIVTIIINKRASAVIYSSY